MFLTNQCRNCCLYIITQKTSTALNILCFCTSTIGKSLRQSARQCSGCPQLGVAKTQRDTENSIFQNSDPEKSHTSKLKKDTNCGDLILITQNVWATLKYRIRKPEQESSRKPETGIRNPEFWNPEFYPESII